MKKIPDIIHDAEVDHDEKSSSICNHHHFNNEVADNILNAVNLSIKEELTRQSCGRNKGFIQSFPKFFINDIVVVRDKMMGGNFIGKLNGANSTGLKYFVKPIKDTRLENSVWASVISTTQDQYYIVRKANLDEAS